MTSKRAADRYFWRYTVLFGPTRVTVPVVGRTLNLSPKGIGIHGDEVFPPGTELRIVVRPHEEGPFELVGKVVWSKQSAGQMGIRLTQWDDEYPDFVHRAEATLHPKERPTIPPPPPPPPDPEPAPSSWPTGLRHPRFSDQLPVRFGLGGSLDRKGFTGNISRTGLGLRTSESVSPGAMLQIAITLPDEKIARLQGIVAWSNVAGEGGHHAELGVQIQEHDDTYTALVEDWERRH